jgi:hypothetical protein
MTHGGPHPTSGANYIIICEGRIEAMVATNSTQKIRAASSCAARLTSHIEATAKKKDDYSFRGISALQHYMMDHLSTMSAAEVDAKVAEMFDLLDALEDQAAGY